MAPRPPGLPERPEGVAPTTAAALAAGSPVASTGGAASAVPGPPPTDSGASRTKLNAPAASASPPTANSTFRGRGLR
ncbi:hypothetical protein SAVCW2_47520 [Streptomyces avermitilis]|uniref:hypothetical protein n=1 Tax=Streptomyces avermitilis TaxID=33903 RepID=UPI0010E8D376|nr:hypothetical protein [Streptomyces avermitilis]GDY85553.1 hypothetical protein SAVCW2_47520 [Streptomyces avermitilis]